MDGVDPRLKQGPHLTDQDLMVGLRAGDQTVLPTILSRYLIPLRRYAERILGKRADAEEAVQEAFVRLWEKRDHWRAKGSLKALLFTLTRNASVDMLRRRGGETFLSEERLESTPGSGPSPFDETHEQELRSMAERAVLSLPARRQEVFRLVREGGLSYREVSETLGISPQTVANLMSLALADLRSSLKPLLGDTATVSPDGERTPRTEEASGSD